MAKLLTSDYICPEPLGSKTTLANPDVALHTKDIVNLMKLHVMLCTDDSSMYALIVFESCTAQ